MSKYYSQLKQIVKNNPDYEFFLFAGITKEGFMIRATPSFLCACGNFRAYNEQYMEWICEACDKWLKEHYKKCKDCEKTDNNNVNMSYYIENKEHYL